MSELAETTVGYLGGVPDLNEMPELYYGPLYHKIQSVFKRDPENNYKTFLDEYTNLEFEYLSQNIWVGTEKIDGTNMRIHWDGEQVTVHGRTNKAELQPQLVQNVTAMFPAEKFDWVDKGRSVTLYGEGYGPGIQKGGGAYRTTKSFILFDAFWGMEHGFWAQREEVTNIANVMGISRSPEVFWGVLQHAIEYVADGFMSTVAEVEGLNPQHPAEGLVLRPEVELKGVYGQRIITKLKTKDFK